MIYVIKKQISLSKILKTIVLILAMYKIILLWGHYIYNDKIYLKINLEVS